MNYPENAKPSNAWHASLAADTGHTDHPEDPISASRRYGIAAPTAPLSSWRDLLPALLLLVVGALALAAATLSPSGRDGQYAVVAPPWYSIGQTVSLIQQAGGRIAEVGAGRHIVVAQSGKPGFAHDLYRAGAWLVLDPGTLRGCIGFAPLAGEARS